MKSNYIATKDVQLFSDVANQLRRFFLERGYVEVHTQDRLSILAACEDPATIATYGYAGELWPLPQTGQMWLEYELLRNPTFKGVFCVSTSYRLEPNPVPGRHELIFPMFEFEAPGTFDDMVRLETELCLRLGFGNQENFAHVAYDNVAKRYGVEEITSEEERRMRDDYGFVTFLKRFPQRTAPFWNMKQDGNHSRKVDVIINGMEVIGSAERSTNKEEMRANFARLSGGQYAGLLYKQFGKERVDKELEEYLSFDFFPRFGGGIGVTRLLRAVQVARDNPKMLA